MADKGCKATLLSWAQVGLSRAQEGRCRRAAEQFKQTKRHLRKGPCGPAVHKLMKGWVLLNDCK